jgi:hypothetical protein
MKKLKHIFAIAAAAFAMAVTPAEALEVGDSGSPAEIIPQIQQEGHAPAVLYDHGVLYGDNAGTFKRNIFTINSDSDWYLLYGNASLKEKLTKLEVLAEGSDLTFYKPLYDSILIPGIAAQENAHHIQKLQDAGQNGIKSRSDHLAAALSHRHTYLAFTANIRNEAGKITGFLDAIVGQKKDGILGVNLLKTDAGGAAYFWKIGLSFSLADNFKQANYESFVDLEAVAREQGLTLSMTDHETARKHKPF